MMKKKYLLIAVFCCLVWLASKGQGMVLNEFSNGDIGTREYMEFVVVGPDANPNCGPVDLRGWIVDDNNGDFSCGPCSGTGIASGHLRLAFGPTWSAVPTGSIIVVYNDDPGEQNLNMPPADPDDTAPADGVYIVPASSSLLDVSTGSSCGAGNIPFGLTGCPGPCTGSSGYTGACYTSGGSWANAGLRNGGDAAQVRRPDGTYFHGVGYGNASSDINGGPEGLFISGTGGGNFYMFDHSVSDDYRAVANWSGAGVSTNGETPGAPNNADNATWIAGLGAPCPLPVVYAHELSGQSTHAGNLLTWTTAQEVNSDRFVVEKSLQPSEGFEFLGEVKAAGNSMVATRYEFVDTRPAARSWYRLRQVDLDGREDLSRVVSVHNAAARSLSFVASPNPANDRLLFRLEGPGLQSVQLMDLAGRVIAVEPVQGEGIFEGELDTRDLSPGMYLLQARTAEAIATRRIVIRH